MENGLIVDVKDRVPYVKTQNGVVRLIDIETEPVIKPGVILS